MIFNRYQFKKRKLALVIPAHNEEMVIADTIHSAIAAGQHPADIFVVSDGSKDDTVKIASELLAAKNILDQPQSGKAKAILHAIEHFGIISRYEWLHIADADGVFAITYFSELQSRLSREYVAATGYIQSLQGGWISKYRTYEYTLGLEILRRIQAFLGVIPVIPGPTSVFRTDILNKLDFSVDSLTEDMDITLQIHRGRLGKIAYIPQAKTFTQDPKDLTDYMKQISRWYRGNFQVMMRHRVGLHPQKIDAYLSYVMFEQWILVAQLTVLPFMAWWGQNYRPLALMFLSDLLIFTLFTMWAAAKNPRSNVMGAFPLFYILRFVSLIIFIRSWYEIVVQRKFNSPQAGWDVAGRRYRIVTNVAR
ncbi:MAG: glycosyltransferase family 2 protein [Patescibacteria group bacterium]|nr:glycosyltransferase family 2 protein [Patescibacteria group bacterium]